MRLIVGIGNTYTYNLHILDRSKPKSAHIISQKWSTCIYTDSHFYLNHRLPVICSVAYALFQMQELCSYICRRLVIQQKRRKVLLGVVKLDDISFIEVFFGDYLCAGRKLPS